MLETRLLGARTSGFGFRTQPGEFFAFGSELLPLAVPDRDRFTEDVRRALYASKVIAYAQGFDHIAAGSREYGWGIDQGAMATIWRGGCIIRARFLNRIREAYDKDPELPSLLQRYVDAGAGPALILSGSALSTMSELVEARAPLYGRAASIVVPDLDLLTSTTAQLAKKKARG